VKLLLAPESDQVLVQHAIGIAQPETVTAAAAATDSESQQLPKLTNTQLLSRAHVDSEAQLGPMSVDDARELPVKFNLSDPRDEEILKSNLIFERLKQKTVYNWISWLLVALPLLELAKNLYQDYNPDPRPMRDCLVDADAITSHFTQVFVDGYLVFNDTELYVGNQLLLTDQTGSLLPTCVQMNAHDPSTLADFDNGARFILSFVGIVFFVAVVDILIRLEFNARKAMFLLKHRVLVHNDSSMRFKELRQIAAITLLIFLYLLLKAVILQSEIKVFQSSATAEEIWAVSYDFEGTTLLTTFVGSLFFLSLLAVFYKKIDDIYTELKFSELVQYNGHSLLMKMSYISKTDMIKLVNEAIADHFGKAALSGLFWYLPCKKTFKCHLIDDSHPVVRDKILPRIFAHVKKINMDDLSKDCFYQDI
jgi:hypothetical protein